VPRREFSDTSHVRPLVYFPSLLDPAQVDSARRRASMRALFAALRARGAPPVPVGRLVRRRASLTRPSSRDETVPRRTAIGRARFACLIGPCPKSMSPDSFDLSVSRLLEAFHADNCPHAIDVNVIAYAIREDSAQRALPKHRFRLITILPPDLTILQRIQPSCLKARELSHNPRFTHHAMRRCRFHARIVNTRTQNVKGKPLGRKV
jgi:hypothetical protein